MEKPRDYNIDPEELPELPMPSLHPPASLLRRLAAALYDGLLLLAVWMVATFPLLFLTGGEAIASGSPWYALYLLSITGGFHVWFWTHGGQTLGMRAWRLKVQTQGGASLSVMHAGRRYLWAVLSWMSIGGVLWCWLDPTGRALHDRFSQSDIVCLPKGVS